MGRGHSRYARARAGERAMAWPVVVLAGSLVLSAALGTTLWTRATYAAASVHGPSFRIVSPANGSTVSDPVTLEVAVRDAKIGPPSSGRDHLHISIDGGRVYAMYHYRTLSLRLPKGKNTISVDLAYPTHMPVVPWQTVTFSVR